MDAGAIHQVGGPWKRSRYGMEDTDFDFRYFGQIELEVLLRHPSRSHWMNRSGPQVWTRNISLGIIGV